MAEIRSKYALKRANRFVYSKILQDWIAGAKAGRPVNDLSRQHKETFGNNPVTEHAPSLRDGVTSYHSRLPRRGRHILGGI